MIILSGRRAASELRLIGSGDAARLPTHVIQLAADIAVAQGNVVVGDRLAWAAHAARQAVAS